MTPIQSQLTILLQEHPNATMVQLPSGAHLITIPNIGLPPGWSKEASTVYFVAPVGYPLAAPDCFWADNDLRLLNGAMPQASAHNPIPEVGGMYIWFSWHVSAWNPNISNLLTYLNVIKNRLKAVQ